MPKINIDEQYSSLFEPIEFTLDGVDYRVDKIEAATLESLADNIENPRGMRECFALLVGCDKKEFNKTDFRKLALAMRFINESMKEQLEEFQSKNVPGESVSPTP